MGRRKWPDLTGSPTLAPFRHRTFAMIWAATLLSNSGSVIQTVGAAWMTTTITQSADYVALVQAAAMAPTFLLSLVAGALADNRDRRSMMLAAQIAMFVTSTALAVTAWLGLVSVWSLLTFTFLIGCGGVLHAPAWQASILDQVPREDLSAAVALNSISFNLARTVAPTIGGLLVALGGGALAFSVNAFSYLGLIAVLARWKRPPQADRPIDRLLPTIAAGLRYAAGAPEVRSTLVRGSIMGIGGGAVWSLQPLVARDLLGGGPLVYGFLLGGFGAGAMLGGLLSVRLRAALGLYPMMVGAATGFGLAGIVVGASSSLPLSLAGMVLAGATWVMAVSTFNTLVQTSAPDWVRGRALSIYQMVTFGTLAVGAALWGRIAELAGVREALVCAGVTTVVAQLGYALLSRKRKAP